MPLEPEGRARRRTLLTVILVAAVLLFWIVWWQWEPLKAGLCGPPGVGTEPAGEPVDEAGTQGSEADSWAAALADAERRWIDWFGRSPEWPADFAEPRDCDRIADDLARVCRRLDAAAEVEPAGGSCVLLAEVAERLAERPPDLTSELRSYESILANVHHLFRTVGASRLDTLRGLVRAEGENAEAGAFALYRWLASREACARSGRTPIREDALYDYAGFLFQTMGGQAYLRRRSPAVEALASFYALLILDRAMERNHNPHGVDPRPEIRRTRELLDARPWVFGDRYRAVLDEMEQRWKRREPAP